MELQQPSEAVLKRLSKIGDRKYQSQYNEFLIEGVRFVEEAFSADVSVAEIAVVFGAEKNARIADNIENAQLRSIPVWSVPARQMERISRTEHNQGIAAGVNFPSKTAGDILGELLQLKDGIVLFLDAVQDPGNLGTSIRTAEAFNLEGVVLGAGCAGLFNPKSLRCTMGAVFRMKIAEMHDKSSKDILRAFENRGFQVVAADSSKDAKPMDEMAFERKVLLIVGNEGAGISDEVAKKSSRFRIPTPGPTESLNTAIAGAIAVYYISKHRK